MSSDQTTPSTLMFVPQFSQGPTSQASGLFVPTCAAPGVRGTNNVGVTTAPYTQVPAVAYPSSLVSQQPPQLAYVYTLPAPKTNAPIHSAYQGYATPESEYWDDPDRCAGNLPVESDGMRTRMRMKQQRTRDRPNDYDAPRFEGPEGSIPSSDKNKPWGWFAFIIVLVTAAVIFVVWTITTTHRLDERIKSLASALAVANNVSIPGTHSGIAQASAGQSATSGTYLYYPAAPPSQQANASGAFMLVPANQAG